MNGFLRVLFFLFLAMAFLVLMIEMVEFYTLIGR